MHALSSAASAVQAGARPGTRDREDRNALEYAEAARCASAVSALARAEDEANGVARATAPIWQDTPRAGPLGVAGGPGATPTPTALPVPYLRTRTTYP